jgi:hypothetical protein
MTALQSTNRVKLGRSRDVTFGVINTNPVFSTKRQTSSSLAANPQTTVSSEIRSDRQVTDLILLGYQAGGNVAGELSFKAYDDEMEESLQGTWANNPNITVATLDTEISDISTTTATVLTPLGTPFKAGMIVLTGGFTTAANNGIIPRVASSSATTIVFPAATFSAEGAGIPVGASLRVVGFQGASGDLVAVTAGGNAITSTVLDFTTLGLTVGQWVWVGGTLASSQFATAGVGGFCRISAITANRLSFGRVPSTWAADAGATKTIEVRTSDFLINGSATRSVTFERQYLDHSPVSYEYLRGQTADKLTLTADAQKIATIAVDYIGSDSIVSTARQSGATDVAAPTNFVLNTATNVDAIAFNGTAIGTPNYLSKSSIIFNNNLRRQTAVSVSGIVGTGNGEFNVTGTLDFYFGDKTVLDKVVNNTLTSFNIALGRNDGNKEGYMFDFPSIKLSSGSPAVSGKNSDVMITAGFQAIMDATLLYTASICRFWLLP